MMIFALYSACALAQRSDWTIDVNGVWHGPMKTEAAISTIPTKLSNAALVERVEQYHRVHSPSTLCVVSGSALCVRTLTDRTIICGYRRSHWIVAEFTVRDWRKILSTVPNRDLASLSTIVTTLPSESVSHSTAKFSDGTSIDLPPDWAWIDEWIGAIPDHKPDFLFSLGGKEALNIHEIRTDSRHAAITQVGYSGFSEKLIDQGTEVLGSPGKEAGFSYRTKTGWIMLYYSISDRSKVASLERMRKYIASRISTRQGRRSKDRDPYAH